MENETGKAQWIRLWLPFCSCNSKHTINPFSIFSQILYHICNYNVNSKKINKKWPALALIIQKQKMKINHLASGAGIQTHDLSIVILLL